MSTSEAAPVLLGTTFSDVLATVPQLLSSCLDMWSTHGEGIREMRLVSMEASRTAVRAITRFSFELGGSDSLVIPAIIQLLRDLHLQRLRVMVIIKLGSDFPTMSQQLDTCTLQLETIIDGIGAAIKSVTHFKLVVQAQPYAANTRDSTGKLVPSNACIPWGLLCPLSIPEAPDPDKSDQIVRKVCVSFASACPALQCLSLAGCREADVIAVFAAGCPGLSHLKIQAVTVPLHVMDDLSTHLPKLSHFTLTRQEDADNQVHAYIIDVFKKLADCTLLECLVLDLNAPYDSFTLNANGLPWLVLPSSIVELRITCCLENEYQPTREIWKLTAPLKRLTLSLSSIPDHSVEGLLARFLDLEVLVLVTGVSAVENFGPCLELAYVHERWETPGDSTLAELLKARCKAGLRLGCANMVLVGSGKDVEDILSWLPAMPLTTGQVTVRLSDGISNLSDMPRVFPNLSALRIHSKEAWVDLPSTDAELLAPLAGCHQLRRLELQLQLSLTTSAVLQLCLGLPMLHRLSYTPCVGVVLKGLLKELRVAGHMMIKSGVAEYKDASYGLSPTCCFGKAESSSDQESDSD